MNYKTMTKKNWAALKYHKRPSETNPAQKIDVDGSILEWVTSGKRVTYLTIKTAN